MKYTLKQLADKHDYYCSDSNYYSNDASADYENWPQFFNDYKGLDIDMNLIFRWDLIEMEEVPGEFSMEIFMMLQRKGIFRPIRIQTITENDVEAIVEFLKPHWAKLNQIWTPLSETK